MDSYSDKAKQAIINAKNSNTNFIDFYNCKLTQIPEEIFKFTNLTHLNLNSNQLSELPEEFSKLINLRKLYLKNNRFNAFPEVVSTFNELTKLDLSQNNIHSIPNKISNLTNLVELELSNNKLSEVPDSISKLEKLTHLWLNNNQISHLPEGISKLKHLILLSISNNNIARLPWSIENLRRLHDFFYKNNEFQVGEEVTVLSAKEQINQILKWQIAKEAGTLEPINEAKVIFIGESSYGKTHLIEYIRNNEITREINTTHGIERSEYLIPWDDKSIRINIWDLGGQEYMRSTHQFFFTERTLYVLVTLARRERNELNHWLKIANQLGNNAPVLVVINKIDLDSHDLDRRSLQRDYPNIMGFVRTCIYDCEHAKATDTVSQLREQIMSIITNKEIMPGVFEKRPSEWFRVKSELETLEINGTDYITYKEYEQLNFIKDLSAEERKTNLKLFSILGSVVSYVDDPRLIDTNVINPQWILDGVYSIINDFKIKEETKGFFQLKELERILPPERFPKTRHPFLLDLMQKFNICYLAKKNDAEYYCLPDLFVDIEPEFEWDSAKSMHFRYNYDDSSPEAFITRFIVEMHEDIMNDTRWRSGVLISNGTCQAKVYQTFRKNYIDIEVIGTKGEQRRYLYAIREVFRRLHKPYPEMPIKQEVKYKNCWIDYLWLAKLEIKEKPYFHPELEEDLPITEILNGYSTKYERENEILKRIENDIKVIKDGTIELNVVLKHTSNLISFALTQKTTIEYPNLFTLKPKRTLMSSENQFYSDYEMQLFCSDPSCLHPVGNKYELKMLKNWVKTLAPYYNALVKVFKEASPLVTAATFSTLGPAASLPGKLTAAAVNKSIKEIPKIGDSFGLRAYTPRSATEAEMQIIKEIIDTADPKKTWMKHLEKVVFKGKILWLCKQHADEFWVSR